MKDLNMIKTFYEEDDLKESLLRYTKEHQEADAYIRGIWVDKNKKADGKFKGCFYGCMTQSENNTLKKASEQYGLPLWYVYVTERIYEKLPENKWLSFPYEAIKILPVGIDMNMIRSVFHYRLLMDDKMGQINYCVDNKKCRDSIIKCAKLFEQSFSSISWSAARSAARSAVESAVESAAWSAAESAAKSAEYAARSVESAAESAAESAVESAVESAARSVESAARSAESAARSEYYLWMKNMLFDCIKRHSENIDISNKSRKRSIIKPKK